MSDHFLLISKVFIRQTWKWNEIFRNSKNQIFSFPVSDPTVHQKHCMHVHTGPLCKKLHILPCQGCRVTHEPRNTWTERLRGWRQLPRSPYEPKEPQSVSWSKHLCRNCSWADLFIKPYTHNDVTCVYSYNSIENKEKRILERSILRVLHWKEPSSWVYNLCSSPTRGSEINDSDCIVLIVLHSLSRRQGPMQESLCFLIHSSTVPEQKLLILQITVSFLCTICYILIVPGQ